MENEQGNKQVNSEGTLQMSRKKVKVVFGSLALVIVLLACGAGYFYYKSSTASSDEKAKKVLSDSVSAIGKLIMLPTDEQPTLATVSDPEKLKAQPFFANAEVGDVVLVYARAKKAILYSPKYNKIIEVAPVNLAPATQEPSVAAPASVTNMQSTPNVQSQPQVQPQAQPKTQPQTRP